MYGHPVQTRAAIQQVANEVYEMSIQDDLDHEEQGRDRIVLREVGDKPGIKQANATNEHRVGKAEEHTHKELSEGALNIRGLLIHVAGDALGSLGVIVSGLIIWLTKGKHRFYADPALSVAITILIMYSAVPLGMSPSDCDSGN